MFKLCSIFRHLPIIIIHKAIKFWLVGGLFVFNNNYYVRTHLFSGSCTQRANTDWITTEILYGSTDRSSTCSKAQTTSVPPNPNIAQSGQTAFKNSIRIYSCSRYPFLPTYITSGNSSHCAESSFSLPLLSRKLIVTSQLLILLLNFKFCCPSSLL